MKLKFSQLMVISCGIAFQAFLLVVLNAFIPKHAGADAIWIAFQAWAVYFLAGCTILGGIRSWIGYATGIAASIGIIELMGVPGIKDIPSVTVSGMYSINFVMALAVFIVVIPAIMSEKFKNMVPALFIGSGAFFALTNMTGVTPWAPFGVPRLDAHMGAVRVELVYCAVGLLFGFITVFWRTRYEASLAKKKQETAET